VKPRSAKRQWFVLALGVAAVAFGLPRVLGPYDLHIVTLAFINAIMALSLNFTLGYVGQPNFGQAMLFGVGAYTSGLLSVRLGVPFAVSILSAGMMGLVFAAVFGPIVLRLRDAYFCMVTIALAQTFMLVANNLISFTGGPMGLPGIPFGSLFGRPLGPEGFFLVSLALLLLAMLVTYRLEKSVVGRAWIGMRDSETLARSVGVNTYLYAVIAYIVGGFFGGVAGGLTAHFTSVIDPKVFMFEISSMAVVGTVLGGSGTVWGPVVGALLVTLLPEYLRLAAMWRLPIFGLFLVIVVVLMPRGLVPTVVDLFARRADRTGPGRPTAARAPADTVVPAAADSASGVKGGR